MLTFAKYQGAGNDFILLDARAQLPFALDNQPLIERLCDRHFGIGADGLMLLRHKAGYDFEMVYYNSDGRPSSMCGNGGRCIVAFAAALGITQPTYHFLAADGPHEARILEDGNVALGMSDVRQVEQSEDHYVLNTGSPHFVSYVTDALAIDLVPAARAIRYNDRFAKEGINVNFVTETPTGLTICTYERGVEDETLACGTGVTAAAISLAIRNNLAPGNSFNYAISAKGGNLRVTGKRVNHAAFTNLQLIGPATFVFSGNIAIDL